MAESARPRRRWRKWLALAGLLVLIGALWIDRQLQPERVTARLTEQARAAGLDLRVAGAAHYRFVPRIAAELPAVTLSAGAQSLLLSAQAVRVDMPWSSLLSGPLVLDQLTLVRPVLDLDALRTWLASRPNDATSTPDVRLKVRIEQAKLIAAGQVIADHLDADLANHANLATWLAQWSPAASGAALMPPLNGTLTAPSLRLGDTHIRGLHVEIEDDAPTPRKP